jgi:serpin B
MNTRIGLVLLTILVVAPLKQANADQIDVNRLAQSEETFSRLMYDQLRGTDGNVCFSPYSVQSALAMTMAGAKGRAADEMFRALSLPIDRVHARPQAGVPQPWIEQPWHVDRVHRTFGELTGQLKNAGKHKSIDLAVANSIWPAARFEMRDQFVTTLKQNYGISVTPTGFPDPGMEKINAWVEDNTNDRIKNLLKPGMLNDQTQLVLVNAIYFKGNWRHPFDADVTRDQPFHLTADKRVNVPTMIQGEHFKYFADDTKQVLELPYKGDELSLVVVLPKTIDGLGETEKQLDLTAINRKLKATRPREVIVHLPKFKFEYEKTLNEPLMALGMKLAFTDKADFTGMSPQGDELFISIVQHKAFIEVNETGSEAAAATAVAIQLESAMIEPPPTFRADRPFLFHIRHIKTGTVLFMGRVTDPRG